MAEDFPTPFSAGTTQSGMSIGEGSRCDWDLDAGGDGFNLDEGTGEVIATDGDDVSHSAVEAESGRMVDWSESQAILEDIFSDEAFHSTSESGDVNGLRATRSMPTLPSISHKRRQSQLDMGIPSPTLGCHDPSSMSFMTKHYRQYMSPTTNYALGLSSPTGSNVLSPASVLSSPKDGGAIDDTIVQQAAFILGEYFGVDPYTFLSFGQILAQRRSQFPTHSSKSFLRVPPGPLPPYVAANRFDPNSLASPQPQSQGGQPTQPPSSNPPSANPPAPSPSSQSPKLPTLVTITAPPQPSSLQASSPAPVQNLHSHPPQPLPSTSPALHQTDSSVSMCVSPTPTFATPLPIQTIVSLDRGGNITFPVPAAPTRQTPPSAPPAPQTSEQRVRYADETITVPAPVRSVTPSAPPTPSRVISTPAAISLSSSENSILDLPNSEVPGCPDKMAKSIEELSLHKIPSSSVSDGDENLDDSFFDEEDHFDEEEEHSFFHPDPSPFGFSVQYPKTATEEDNERKFACESCGKRYKQKSHLLVHRRTHEGVRPFVCHIEPCTKSFITNSALRAHLRVHSGERPYLCGFDGCGRTFSTNSNLRRHERTHGSTSLKRFE